MITIEMAKALSKFQSICPEINLDGKVSFGKTDFRYATLPNIITKTRKPLEEAGLVVSQPMIGGKIPASRIAGIDDQFPDVAGHVHHPIVAAAAFLSGFGDGAGSKNANATNRA